MMRRHPHPPRAPVLLRFFAAVAIALTLALWLPERTAQAHAIVVESTPTVGSEVQGSDIAVMLRYNTRVDKARSRLTLLAGDKTIRLTIENGGEPDVLTAKATGLAPGPYRLRWQVLALDGHITRGEIPFAVTAP